METLSLPLKASEKFSKKIEIASSYLISEMAHCCGLAVQKLVLKSRHSQNTSYYAQENSEEDADDLLFKMEL